VLVENEKNCICNASSEILILVGMKARCTEKLIILASFTAIYLIWGSTYLAIRVGLETMPPFSMAAVRFLCAGVILYVLGRVSGAPAPTWQNWRSAAVIGIALTTLGNGLVVFAEQRVPSAFAALLIPLVSMWLTLFGWWSGEGIRPSRWALSGIALGLAGVGLLSAHSLSSDLLDVRLLDVSMLVFATLAWAYGTVYARQASGRGLVSSSSVLSTGMQMLCGTLFLIALAWATGEGARIDPDAWSVRSFAALAYMIVFGSIVAFSAYTYLLQRIQPSVLGTYSFVNPLIAMLLGWAMYDEPIGGDTLIAACLILMGVACVLYGNARAARKRTAASAKEEVVEVPKLRKVA